MENTERPIKRRVYNGIRRDLNSISAFGHVQALRALRDPHNNNYTFVGDEDYEHEPLNEEEIAWLRRKALQHERNYAESKRRAQSIMALIDKEAAEHDAKTHVAKRQQQTKNVLKRGMTDANDTLQNSKIKKSDDCGGSHAGGDNGSDGGHGTGDGANDNGNDGGYGTCDGANENGNDGGYGTGDRANDNGNDGGYGTGDGANASGNGSDNYLELSRKLSAYRMLTKQN